MAVTIAGNILASSQGEALPISMGGTGQTTAPTAINALLPTQSNQSGKILVTNGTDVFWNSVVMTPGGSDTMIQYNDAGTFGGNAFLVINKSTGAITSTSTLTNAGLIISNSAELYRTLSYQTLGSDRWLSQVNNNVEVGSNTGSNFEFVRVADNGLTSNIVYSVNRATGVFDFKTTPTVNGTAISTSASAGSLTGTTLASNVVSSSLTSVGTLANLTVTGTIVGSINGTAAKATALNGGAAGNIVYQSGTNTTAFLANGTSGQVLTSNGASIPTWTTPASGAANTLTGTTLASNIVTSSLTSVGTLANLTVTGTITGSVNGSSASVINAVTFNNAGTGAASPSSFNGGSATTISYNTIGAPSTTGTNASGTWNISISGNAATASSATSTTTSTNIAGGAIGYLPYQSAADTTSYIAPGTSLYVLTSNGPSAAPTWQVPHTPAYPANQIVYGTGTSSSTYSTLTYDPAVNILTVGGTGVALVEAGTSQPLRMISDTALYLSTGTSTVFTDWLAINTDGSVAVNGSVGAAGQVFVSAGAGAPAAWSNSATISNIPNSSLTNSSVTIGSTAFALGSTHTTLAGLTSVTSTTFVGALTGAASSNLLLTGGSMTGTITMDGTHTVTGLPDPTNASDAANKNYVDNAVAGLEWKASAAVATTANITLSGLQAIDTYTTLAGDRVLVKNQTNQTQNGIYIAASGAWSRSTDANTSAELSNASLYVTNGSINLDTGWTQTTANPTIGSSNIVFAQFTGGGSFTAGTGISIAGNIISNAGVTSNVAGTNISVSSATGAVTIGLVAAPTFAGTNLTGTAASLTVGTANALNVANAYTGTTFTASTQFTGPGTGLTGTASSLTAGAATNLAGGAAGSIAYQTGPGATTMLAAGTNGYVLTLAAGVPTWAAGGAGGVSSAVAGTNITVSGATGAVTIATTLTPSFTTVTAAGAMTSVPVAGAGSYTVGYLEVPQRVTGTTTLGLSDSGKHIYTASGGQTYTIPANSSVAYPIGTAISFVNQSSTPCTIAITSDTLYLAGAGTTGSRTVGTYGFATILKIAATTWIISGTAIT
jgi:hypothetical protein